MSSHHIMPATAVCDCSCKLHILLTGMFLVLLLGRRLSVHRHISLALDVTNDHLRLIRGATLISSLPRIEISGYSAKYVFEESFVDDLKKCCDMAPFGGRSMRHIMFTLSSGTHFYLAMNLACSSLAAGVTGNFHIFMLTDSVMMRTMKAVVRNVLFLNVTDNTDRKFFCKLKLFVQYKLSRMWVESTVCDDDVVFISNPGYLLKSDRDIEFGSESMVYGAEDHDFRFNIGFMHVVPSGVILNIYALWLMKTVSQNRNLDQEVLLKMIAKYRIRRKNPTLEQDYDMKKVLGAPAILKVRFFHPLDVIHGGLLYNSRSKTAAMAQIKGYKAPVVVHLAWISGLARKKKAFDGMSLIFTDGNECMKLNDDLYRKGFHLWRRGRH